jgi:hypothetical protein
LVLGARPQAKGALFFPLDARLQDAPGHMLEPAFGEGAFLDHARFSQTGKRSLMKFRQDRLAV